MSQDKIELLKKYFRASRDLGEEGFYPNNEECAVKDKLLNKLKEEVEKCRKCKLGSQRLNPCFGSGDAFSRIMFIGEGPGFDEDHRGEVFVGRAGKLLTKIILNVFNLKREDVYITNIVKCHPMKDPSDPEKRGNDRPPAPAETNACIGYLYRQIDIIKPGIIVPLGAPATRTILESENNISSLRGKVYEKKIGNTTVNIVPTYHPAYLLRSPSKKAETFEDTKLIKGLL